MLPLLAPSELPAIPILSAAVTLMPVPAAMPESTFVDVVDCDCDLLPERNPLLFDWLAAAELSFAAMIEISPVPLLTEALPPAVSWEPTIVTLPLFCPIGVPLTEIGPLIDRFWAAEICEPTLIVELEVELLCEPPPKNPPALLEVLEELLFS